MTDTSRYFVDALEKWASEIDVEIEHRADKGMHILPGMYCHHDHIRAILDGAPQGTSVDLLDEYIAALERACKLGRELAPHIDDAQVALFRAREWRAKRGALHEEAEALLDGGGMEDHDAD